MDDEREILIIALSNSLIVYNDLLENSKNEENKEGIELLEYTIKRHEELLQKYSSMVISDTPLTQPISRPGW